MSEYCDQCGADLPRASTSASRRFCALPRAEAFIAEQARTIARLRALNLQAQDQIQRLRTRTDQVDKLLSGEVSICPSCFDEISGVFVGAPRAPAPQADALPQEEFGF